MNFKNIYPIGEQTSYTIDKGIFTNQKRESMMLWLIAALSLVYYTVLITDEALEDPDLL
jgi:hypothetical protein